MIGLFNGFMVVKVGLNPFISTLGFTGAFAWRCVDHLEWAFDLFARRSTNISGFGKNLGPASCRHRVRCRCKPLLGWSSNFTATGRALYAVGGNEEAARAAGINVDRVIWSAFFFAALLSGLAGVLLTGRLDSAVTTQGQGIIFSAFAAAVIGGCQPRWRQGDDHRCRQRCALDWCNQQPANASTSALFLCAGLNRRSHHHCGCADDCGEPTLKWRKDANLSGTTSVTGTILVAFYLGKS